MARNMCYAAQQVLHDRDREGRGPPPCPVAMTSKQEREAMGGNTTYWCKSGKDLWKLKSQQPHLFARQNGGSADGPSQPRLPPGYEETTAPGWLRHAERQVFLETATQRMFWLDRATGAHRELAQGADLSGCLSISGGASASASSKSEPGRQAARHVVIMDLHKAAEAFKLDLGHLDRPAAMLAVFGCVEGAMPAELAARALHEKLLKRLGSFRSRWSDEALQAVVAESFAMCSEPAAERGVAAAVALLLGGKLVAAAAHGATCVVASPSGEVLHELCSTSADVNAACMDLSSTTSPCVLLLTEPIQESARLPAVAQAAKGRPRAGAVALRCGQPDAAGSPGPPRAAACARLLWSGEPESAPAPKRPRTEASAEARVRCRQILLKYAGCSKPSDPVRRRPVRRSLAEAEVALLGVLRELDGGGEAAFARQCRAISECSSSLKGGDLVGDVGWLSRPVERPGERPSKEAASRHAVIRAAFELEVGELSDILVSDDGVHVLQRRA